MKHLASISFLILAAVVPPANGEAQPISVPLTDPARPATLKVSVLNGAISVEGYAGREILIEPGRGEETAEAPRRGAEGMRRIPNHSPGLSVDEDANVVRVEVRNPDRGGDLRIQVPFHTSLHLSAVNGGEIRVRGVEGEIELSHVNGGIDARDVAGSVVAHTTNGNVKVALKRVAPNQPMAFSTLNGDVDVTFPADVKASVRIRSERGEVYSDFDLGASAHAIASETRPRGRRHLEVEQETQGTIGGGGPEMLFKTFNGDVFIRRAGG